MDRGWKKTAEVSKKNAHWIRAQEEEGNTLITRHIQDTLHLHSASAKDEGAINDRSQQAKLN